MGAATAKKASVPNKPGIAITTTTTPNQHVQRLDTLQWDRGQRLDKEVGGCSTIEGTMLIQLPTTIVRQEQITRWMKIPEIDLLRWTKIAKIDFLRGIRIPRTAALLFYGCAAVFNTPKSYGAEFNTDIDFIRWTKIPKIGFIQRLPYTTVLGAVFEAQSINIAPGGFNSTGLPYSKTPDAVMLSLPNLQNANAQQLRVVDEVKVPCLMEHRLDLCATNSTLLREVLAQSVSCMLDLGCY